MADIFIYKNDMKHKIPKILHAPGGLKGRWFMNSLSFVVAILATVIIIIGSVSVSYYYSSVQDNLISQTTSSANFFNKYLNSNYEQFYVGAQKFVTEFEYKDKLEVQIIDNWGRVILSSSGLTSGTIPSTSDVAETLHDQKASIYMGEDYLTGERVVSTSSPLFYSDGTLLGSIRYVTSLEIVEKQIITNVLLTCAIAIFVFALVIVSNRYFIKSILEPVLKINAVAKEIADGKYGKRLQKIHDDEIGELCDTINHMSDELSRVERMKNDFISSVSHELRTPLTAIGGWSETLLTYQTDVSEETIQGLTIINREAQRLTQMVEELLDFGRLESGRLTLDVDICDISRELFEAVYLYRTLLESEDFEINYEKVEADYTINGDNHRLKQVFLNVIDNAAKYGREGGKIDISIEKNEEDAVVVQVKDYGAGILEKDLPFVKQKFYKGTSKKRGSGIGLAVTDEIIAMHGGTFDIISAENEGTLVVITIPSN
ncbi:MAG: HAMP domain-containing sensor histidine kinase [Clostridia bacterium]